MEKTTVVNDWRGRDYRVAPSPPDRSRMFWLIWAAMVAIAPLQYGYASAVPAMSGAGPARPAVLLPLAVWIVCQAAGAIPVLRLVRRGRLGVRTALALGALLSAAGLAAVALADGLPSLLVWYSALGGVGAGLVYGVCTEAVARWFPDRPATRVAFVTGAFGYGAAPLAVALVVAPAARPAAFMAAAVAALLLITLAAFAVRLPPHRWWPAEIDPRAHALDAAILRRTPPALREFSVGQALRTRAMGSLVAILVCAGAVSVFDVVVVAGIGSWAALGLLIALNGGGRACAMLVSDRLGRRRVLGGVLTLLGLGQLLLAAGALMPGVVLAGLGGGAFYPLIAGIVRECFGQERTVEIHTVVYSAKALSGIIGVALVPVAGFAVMCAPALAAALVTLRLRRPGRPVTLPV